MLSLPAIFGASLIQFIKVLNQGAIQSLSLAFLPAAGAAFLTGLASLYVFEYVIKKAKFNWFGYYCLVLGTSYLLFF